MASDGNLGSILPHMRRGLKYLGVVGLYFSLIMGQAAQWEDTDWEIIPQREGAFAYSPTSNITVAYDGVMIKIREAQLGPASIMADRVTVDGDSGELLAEGNITMHQSGLVWRGEFLQYNIQTRQIRTSSFRAGKSPFVMSSGSIQSDPTTGAYLMEDAMVSTDDNQQPALKAEVGSLSVRDREEVTMRNTRLMAGKTPFFYIPFLRAAQGESSSAYQFTPGYRSRYGLFLLNEYELNLNPQLSATFNLDYRTARGLAGGPDLEYDFGAELGSGTFESYFMSDREKIPDPANFSSGKEDWLNPNRYRFGWFHQATLRPNLTAKAAFQKLSDPLMNRDFFESFHRQNTQPRSYLEINQQRRNAALSIVAQPQLNTFFNRVERLPEIKLTGLRQQLGNSPFFYESETTAGYFARNFRYEGGRSFEAARLDTFHQILMPRTYAGWLTLTPKLGGRYGYYSNTLSSDPDQDHREAKRYVFHAGTEISTKLSRVDADFRSSWLDADGLRHVLMPSIQYVFVPEPNARPTALPQFDYEIPTLMMLPVDFPAFNAIDAVDARNVMRVGLRNLFQTKRGDERQVDSLVDWNVFADWRLDPEPGQGALADFTSDLHVQPREWWSLQSIARYSLEESALRVADQGITFLPNNVWSMKLGHMYVRDDPEYWGEENSTPWGTGNNALYSRFYYRINENWGARLNQHYEASDGRLEEHAYTLYRDFRSFTGAFDLRMRNPRGGQEKDITLSVMLSMKAFPQFGLGDDVNKPASFYDSK
ncbi:MAG: LPS-assembly protein LptD [Limisphaerales bacterium]